MIGLSPAALRANFQSLFRPGADIYDEVSEGRQFDALYFSMLVFGCLIALLGLLLNSPAVIIGAMLISPLMGPILSCGLALTLADGTLAKKAGRNLGLSIGETIFIAAIAAWLSPLKEPTAEILARTNPNLMDLLVAFFSGAAGTLALCSRRSGLTIVPGVAVATAVMPPLATVGYGVSTRQWSVASGAFMLFITNLASIMVSADIVFLVLGVRHARAPVQQKESWLIRHRMAISWCVLAVLSIPLVKTLIRAGDQTRVRKEVESDLARELNHPGTRRLDEVTVQVDGGVVSTEATVQTAELISADEQKRIQQELSEHLGRQLSLHLDQIQLAQGLKPPATRVTGHDYLAGGKIRPATAEESRLSTREMLQQTQDSARKLLAPMLHAANVDNFLISSIGVEEGGTLAVTLTGTYQQQALDPPGWKVICTAAAEKFNAPVRLAATMYMPPSQVLWVLYRARNLHASSFELGKARLALADWKKQGLEHGFIVPPDGDVKLSGQRSDYLASHLGQGLEIATKLAGTFAAAVPTSNAVGIVAVQSIDVSATPAGMTSAAAH